MPNKVLIVGGVAGGASAAARLRRNDEAAEIILFERGAYISFANCGLPYYIGGEIQERRKLLIQTPAVMHDRFNLDIRIHSEVISIDRLAKKVQVRSRDVENGESREYEERYDKLLIATGSSPVKPPVPGIECGRVFTCWTMLDADTLAAFLERTHAKRIVVVGGGFVGLEMVENLSRRGITVTVVEMLAQVMSPLDPEMAAFVRETLRGEGVTLCLGRKVTGITTHKQSCYIQLDNASVLEADGLIMSAGIRPNSELAVACGLSTGTKGHIVVNEYMQTSDPNIYAVGDVVEVEDFTSRQKTAVPLAGIANKQGRIAADAICGMQDVYHGAQGTSVAKVFSDTVAFFGLNEKKLRHMGMKRGRDYTVLYSHGTNCPAYYPGSSLLHLKVIYSNTDGRILGVQAIGKAGTEKRIDVLAVCQRFDAPIEALAELELAYAPPYNTPKDAVNFIGYIAQNVRTGKVNLIDWDEISALDPATWRIIDVRTSAEFEAGSIPGSTLIPLNQLRSRLDELDAQYKLVVFCKSGVRSYIAARMLMQHGFEVRSLNGGWLTYSMSVNHNAE